MSRQRRYPIPSACSTAFASAMLLACCLPLVLAAGGIYATARSRPSVFVIAVKDSGLLTMCPAIADVNFKDGGGWKPDGTAIDTDSPVARDLMHLAILPYRLGEGDRRRLAEDPYLRAQRSGISVWLPRPAGELQGSPAKSGSLLEQVELGRGCASTDEMVESALRKEFVRLGRYEVVDSPRDADFVFFAESSYIAQITEQHDGDATAVVRGDWPATLLQSLFAIMVPGDVYRRSPGDMDALMANRAWEGSALMLPPYRYEWTNQVTDVRKVEERRAFTPASPEAVVRQLHGKERRVPSHPVLCAAIDRPFRIDPSAVEKVRSAEVAPTSSPVATSRAGGQTANLQPPPTFRAGVIYVAVSAVVLDSAGSGIDDVEASEFHVFEDDVEQKIDRVIAVSQPFHIAMLADSSTSMRTNVADIQEALLALADKVRPDDRLMAVSFDRLVLLQSPLTTDRDRLRRGVFQMTKRDGTRLYDAIRLTADEPSLRAAERKAIVLLTDGLDTSSRLADRATTVALATDAGAPVYAVLYDTTQDGLSLSVEMHQGGGLISRMEKVRLTADTYQRATQFLQDLTARTGGRFYRASDLSNLSDVFSQVARDLAIQYTVCYYPTNQALDGTYRRIKISVTRPGVTVRARAGYRAVARQN